MSNLIRNCHRCGKDFSAPYKEALCEECLKVLGWESTPLTNADHIRSMTDEELARFLAEVENRRSAAGGGAIWNGSAHAKEWLKQPYKEETWPIYLHQ